MSSRLRTTYMQPVYENGRQSDDFARWVRVSVEKSLFHSLTGVVNVKAWFRQQSVTDVTFGPPVREDSCALRRLISAFRKVLSGPEWRECCRPFSCPRKLLQNCRARRALE